jgi:hypothetical protein
MKEKKVGKSHLGKEHEFVFVCEVRKQTRRTACLIADMTKAMKKLNI